MTIRTFPPSYPLSNDEVKSEPDSIVYVDDVGMLDDNYVKPDVLEPPNPREIYALVPREIVIDSDDDIREIIGNPDVNVILPPLEGDQNIIDPNPYYTDEEQVEDPGYTDGDIDFTVTASTPYRDRRNEILRRRSKRRALKTLAKKELEK